MDRSSGLRTADRCCICLRHFRRRRRVASLQRCPHVFCLQCLLLWAQTSNTCPVDRIRFDFIYQRRCPGGEIEKKIKVRTPRKDGDDEEEEDEVVCEECGRSDRRHRLLRCLSCDSGYHMFCLTPSLNTRPEGNWICPECAASPHHSEESMVEEEISDGEVTDLLAEVDGTASTSSSSSSGRLRPSTTNCPRRSEGRRRSARVQSRTSSSPRPRPQTPLHVPKYLLKASRPPVAAADATSPHQSS